MIAGTPRWQILITTLTSRREKYLDRLLECLRPQLDAAGGRVELLALPDEGGASIGAKRQALLEKATADYVCFIDDDDLVAEHYASRILAVLDGPDPPDIVGFRLMYLVDGRERGEAVHSYDARRIQPTRDIRRIKVVQMGDRVGRGRLWQKMDREPNHLNPVRRELALRVGFQPLNSGEDSEYSRGLARLCPRPRETFIDWFGYYYYWRSVRDGEVTNARIAMAANRT